jgi:hypothetical protein
MDVDLRKLAADIVGRAALEERFGEKRLSALDQVTLHKIASADPELLRVAAAVSAGDILKTYEDLGGGYKVGSSDEPGPNGEPPMSHEEFMKVFRTKDQVDAIKHKEKFGPLAGLIKQKIAGSLEMYEKLGGKYDRPPKGADEQTTTEHELAVEHFHDLMKSDPALAKQRYGSLKQIWRDHFDVANPPSRKYAK